MKRTIRNKVGKAATASRRKGRVNGIVVGALAIGAASVAGYLVWQYVGRRRAGGNDLPGSNDSGGMLPGESIPDGGGVSSGTPPDSQRPPTSIPFPGGAGSNAQGGSAFPLKKGSKGEYVRKFQEALIRKHGKQILPKYGADGGFGTETVSALAKLKLPSVISETLYNVFVQGSTTSTNNSSDLAALGTRLFVAASKKDFNLVLSLLTQIKSSGDYSIVSESFKRNRLGSVRQTLVTGLLNVFTTNSQKEQLRLSFARMGLVYDGQKWSMSGLDGIPIITIRPTNIWINPRQPIRVASSTILGQEITRRHGYVVFANKGRCFLVNADCIRHL